MQLNWKSSPKKFRKVIVWVLWVSSASAFFSWIYRFNNWFSTYSWWEALALIIMPHIVAPVLLSFASSPYLIATFRNHNKTKIIFWLCILTYISIPIVMLLWDYSNSLIILWFFPVILWGGALIWSFTNNNKTKDNSSRVN